MSHTPVRCEHDGIKWFPRGTVEKYSPDQSAWAESRLADQLSWKRRPLVARFGLDRLLGRQIQVRQLHGDWLRDLFPAGPEEGLAATEGNLLVANGLENLVGYLLVGTASPPSGFNVQLSNAHTGCGMGQSSTGAVVGDAKLGGDTGSGSTTSWYQQMDAGFPAWAGAGTANGGQINGQVTVTGSNGNFNWQEWCWFTFTATASPFDAVTISPAPAAFTNPVMQNHWQGISLGTKGSGATWVFSTTITISLSGLMLSTGSTQVILRWFSIMGTGPFGSIPATLFLCTTRRVVITRVTGPMSSSTVISIRGLIRLCVALLGGIVRPVGGRRWYW